MVQEMTQFPSQTLSYDTAYVLPHFKSENQFTTPWENPEILPYGDLARTQTNLNRGFDGTSPSVTVAEAPAVSSATSKKKPRKSGKGSYKHVPHREKPPHLVARRNARERRRVQAVNTAFSRLRKCVPTENRNKRLSKVSGKFYFFLFCFCVSWKFHR